MTVSAEQIAQLRRMINEPQPAPYSDAILARYADRYPVLDLAGLWPDDINWTPTYDLHAAAADIWTEKAAVVASAYDFSADGGSYSRNQQYLSFAQQASYHRARRQPIARKMRRAP